MHKLIKICALTSFCFGFLSQAVAGPIYKYEDSEGTLHFTDTPPEKSHFSEYKTKQVFVLQHTPPPSSSARYYDLAAQGRISPLIQNISQKHDVDPYLIEAIVKAESDYDAMAISKKGAQGLMQLMPGTGVELGLSNPFDPTENLDAGVRHFKRLITKYSNNIDLALAAYNAGEMSVQKYNGVPPYPETLDYIQKIKKYYSQFSQSSITPSIHSDIVKPVPYL